MTFVKTKLVIFAVGLLLLSRPVAGGEFDSLSSLLEAGWTASQPMTVEEIEERELARIRETSRLPHMQDVPDVPFGYVNDKWQALLEKREPGDIIVQLNSPEEYWAQLAGWTGYAVVREDQIIGTLAVAVN